MQTITEILIIEHGKMRELLARFLRALDRDKEETRGALDLFKEKEKSHVFIEEKTIFNFNKKVKIPILKTILAQHAAMAKIIARIDEKVEKEFDPTEDALNLQSVLRAHTDLEEKKFYSVIDKELNEEEKAELISKINELFGE